MGEASSPADRAAEILWKHGIESAEAAIAARVMVSLPPAAWNDLWLSRVELARAIGMTIAGVTGRETHIDYPDAARPQLTKKGPSGKREVTLWLAPVALAYYAEHPPRDAE